MLNAANLITLVRLALVPVMGWCVVSGRYAAAAAVFLIAALSDLATATSRGGLEWCRGLGVCSTRLQTSSTCSSRYRSLAAALLPYRSRDRHRVGCASHGCGRAAVWRCTARRTP